MKEADPPKTNTHTHTHAEELITITHKGELYNQFVLSTSVCSLWCVLTLCPSALILYTHVLFVCRWHIFTLCVGCFSAPLVSAYLLCHSLLLHPIANHHIHGTSTKPLADALKTALFACHKSQTPL